MVHLHANETVFVQQWDPGCQSFCRNSAENLQKSTASTEDSKTVISSLTCHHGRLHDNHIHELCTCTEAVAEVRASASMFVDQHSDSCSVSCLGWTQHNM